MRDGAIASPFKAWRMDSFHVPLIFGASLIYCAATVIAALAGAAVAGHAIQVAPVIKKQRAGRSGPILPLPKSCRTLYLARPLKPTAGETIGGRQLQRKWCAWTS